MTTINTHGYEITNLAEAAKETVTCYRGSYIQIFYDIEEKKIYTHYHVSENNWTQYDDPAVINVCGTRRHMTQQALADAVAEAMAEHKALSQYDY